MSGLSPPSRQLSHGTAPAKQRSGLPEPSQLGTVLIAFPGHLGDAVIGLPVLAAARRLFSEARLDILLNPTVIELVRPHVPNAQLIPWTPSWFPDAGDEARFRPPAVCLSRKYDLAVELRGELQSAVALRSVRAKTRIGLDELCSSFLLDAAHRIRFGTPQREILSSPFRLLEPAFCLEENPARPVRTDGPPRVGIAPGAGCQSKQWPTENFSALCLRLHEARPEIIIRALGNKSDRRFEIASIDEDERGSRPPEKVDEVLMDCDVLVANDSFLGHLACLYGVPSVIIFSAANDVERWQPRGPGPVTVLHRPPDCALCRLRNCSHRSCLVAITPAEVAEAVEEFLARSSR